MRKQILNEGCIWRLGVSATMDEDEYSLHGLWDDEEQLAGVAVGNFLCIWLASDQRHFSGWFGIPHIRSSPRLSTCVQSECPGRLALYHIA